MDMYKVKNAMQSKRKAEQCKILMPSTSVSRHDNIVFKISCIVFLQYREFFRYFFLDELHELNFHEFCEISKFTSTSQAIFSTISR